MNKSKAREYTKRKAEQRKKANQKALGIATKKHKKGDDTAAKVVYGIFKLMGF